MDLALVLALLVATIVMFACNRPRMDAVAVLMIVLLPLTGTVTMAEALAGFSDPNIILIAALFVVGEALVRTGVAQGMGDLLVRKAGASEVRLLILLMLSAGLIGAFMSSTGVVAIFIPVVLRIATNAGIAPGRLMMPLAFAALISGMLTLVATAPNLVINSQLIRAGFEGFGFFAFTPFGLPILLLAVGYMVLARRWLGGKVAAGVDNRPRLADWTRDYALAARECRLQVGPQSDWQGQRLDQLDLRAAAGVNIIGIGRGQGYGRQLLHPRAETLLQHGDVLYLDVIAEDADIAAICLDHGLIRLPGTGQHFTDQAQDIGMVELILPPESGLIGQSPAEARFRSQYDLAILGIRHGTDPVLGPVAHHAMRLGDTLLAVGPWRAIDRLRLSRELIVLTLPAERDETILRPGRAPHALAVLALIVGLMVWGGLPNVQVALMGCLLLGLFGCVDMAVAYRAIHWQTLVLIVGMLPFSIALQNTGGVDIAAGYLAAAFGDSGPRIALAAIFGLTAVLGLFISNTATAVLMAPVALALAASMGLSPYPFAMTVALAASAAFLTPVSSPVNTLVTGPGGYGFFDFLRMGLPLVAMTLALTLLLVPMVFPF